VVAARTGDFVKALVVSRDPAVVEGILHLRFVPTLGYVQVNVITDGGMYAVDPDSIEVLRSGAVAIAELEDGDPLTSDAGWRRIVDLDKARGEDLVSPTRIREGGTWEDMFASLDQIVAPLLHAGWRNVKEWSEESWEHGDSVAYDFERAATGIEIELYEEGRIVAWSVEPAVDTDDLSAESSEPLFVVHEKTDEARFDAFRSAGWLDRPCEGA
jgi:hypothetical protein